MVKYGKGFKNLIARILVFLGLFVVISGITGPWIIGTKLLYGFHFYIYGNMGKVLLLGSIAFLILAKDKITSFPYFKFNKSSLFFILLGFAFIPVFFVLAKQLLLFSAFNVHLMLSLYTHFILLFSVFLVGYGVFGNDLINYFFREYWREIKICLGFAVLMYFAIFQVWKLWPIFSKIVLYAVTFLFGLTYTNVTVHQPYTLVVNNFAVKILQACSGVDSMFLFTSLYVFIGLVDWKVLNHKKYFLLFLPALAGLFLVNILRIYLIILIGVWGYQELSLKLFHTYAGLLFFVAYFLVFLKLSYSRIRK
ncbi:hypothetical protein C4561_00165 [candidate division WWE3 bacterium]|uniref:Exosortase/archaeosortase family protein n=1 Tax=candidate division WWE3 bacterium TaxID=2053526 RepID=A0A3A4ZGV1_UNCKA|nr:MAG: hypothetical protein C4561_00165 [candidate division WWE3 bacterium]